MFYFYFYFYLFGFQINPASLSLSPNQALNPNMYESSDLSDPTLLN
jgi:hypothetical protein